ncbi:MAG: GerMN domain-containing protein [Clostridia bacterium]
MKKILLVALGFILVMSAMTACNQTGSPVNPGNQSTVAPTATATKNPDADVKVFYRNQTGDNLIAETRQISFVTENEKYQNTLVALFQGSTAANVMETIHPNTISYGVILQKDGLIIDLSNEFIGFAGVMEEEYAVGAIVNTMLQFPEIKKVKILVEGEEMVALSGNPRGFMTAFDFTPSKLVKKTISLFYADIGANNLFEEKRQITVDSKITTADLAKRALEEQIKGTHSKKRTSPLNAKIRVISLRLKGDLVNLNLSKELYDSCEGTTGETMAVDAIVKVMLQFPEIKQILVKVEGKTFATGHNIYDQPLNIDNITWSEPG